MKVQAERGIYDWRLFVEIDVPVDNGKIKKKKFYVGTIGTKAAMQLVKNGELVLEIDPNEECLSEQQRVLQWEEKGSPYCAWATSFDYIKKNGQSR